MCDFVSGIIRESDEEVLVYDYVSHSNTAEYYKLKGEEYREWEWKGDGEKYLVVRVPIEYCSVFNNFLRSISISLSLYSAMHIKILKDIIKVRTGIKQ